jgi:hypothetical protein
MMLKTATFTGIGKGTKDIKTIKMSEANPKNNLLDSATVFKFIFRVVASAALYATNI